MSSKGNEPQASEISRLSEEGNEAKTDPEEVERKSSEASEDSEGETEIPATTTVTPIDQAIQKERIHSKVGSDLNFANMIITEIFLNILDLVVRF